MALKEDGMEQLSRRLTDMKANYLAFNYYYLSFLIVQKIKTMLQEILEQVEDIIQNDVPSKRKEFEVNQLHTSGNLLQRRNDQKIDQGQIDTEVLSIVRQNKTINTSQHQRQRKLQFLLSYQSAIFAPKSQCQQIESKWAQQSNIKYQNQICKYFEGRKIKKQMPESSKRQINWRIIKSIVNVFKHKNRICYSVELKNKQIIKVESFNLHRFCPKLVLEFYEKYPNLVKQI